MRSSGAADVLVGRTDEVAFLQSLAKNVVAGQGHSVLIEGEPGIGKSALLATGLATAESLGCRVLWAVADELSLSFPLRVLLESLAPEQKADVTGMSAAGDMWTTAVDDPVLTSVERLLVLVDRLCAASPVVLVLDDLQWADGSSLLVWHRLSRVVDQLPLLLVAASRPAPRRPDVARLRRALLDRDTLLLSLEPLAESQVAELATSLVGELPEPQLRRLTAHAGGNPLYVRELLALDRDIDETAMPASLAEAVADRVALLSPDTGQVLRMAALLGVEFSVMDLSVVAARRPVELIDPIQEASAADVLVESGPMLAFRHPLIRQVLYEAVPAGLRSALHHQVAQALAEAGTPMDRVAEQIVAAEGVTDTWVLDWITNAGHELARRAPSVAADLLSRAVDDMAADDPARTPLEADLAVVLRLLARYDDLERLAREVLVRSADRQHRARMAWALARTLVHTGRAEQALDVTGQALRDADSNEPWTARLRAERAALLLEDIGRPDEGRIVAEQALAEGEHSGSRHAVVHALHVLALNAVVGERDAHTGLAILDRALARTSGEDMESIDQRLPLLANRITVLMTLDQWVDVDSTLREGLALAEKTGTPRMLMLQVAAAAHGFFTGHWDDAVPELESILGYAGELPDVAVLPLLVPGLRALIAAHQDDQPTLDKHLDATRDIATPPGIARANAIYLVMARALAEERNGRPGPALDLLTPTLAPDYVPGLFERHLIPPRLVRLALALGERAVAQAATESCAAEAARDRTPVMQAVADRCRGLLDSDPAPVLAAAEHFRRVGRRFELAETLEDGAVLLGERGDVTAARSALTEAVQTYEALGAAWNVRRADARVRPHGIRRGTRGRRGRPVTGWEALTPTELKVANLVAQGCSNPDIAAQLVLSRRTVHTHVSNILAKLDARSRTEIAREVLQRQD